jgi:hypothetical protein
MFELKIDASAFELRAKQMNASMDQLPFAMSTMLNEAAFAARRVLTESTWPRHVTQRNKTFISASLRVATSTKANLAVMIYDTLGRGHLREHAKSGTITPYQSRNFAIPIKGRVQRTARGVRLRDRPYNLATNSKRSVRFTSKGIFVGQGGHLTMFYAFKRAVFLKKTVPFHEDFAYTIFNHCRTSFDAHMTRAMLTRK